MPLLLLGHFGFVGLSFLCGGVLLDVDAALVHIRRLVVTEVGLFVTWNFFASFSHKFGNEIIYHLTLETVDSTKRPSNLSLRSDDTPEEDEFLWWSDEVTEADDSLGWLDEELSSDSRLPTDLEVC